MLQRCTDPPQDWLPAATALALSVVRAHGAPATAHGPQRTGHSAGPWRSGPGGPAHVAGAHRAWAHRARSNAAPGRGARPARRRRSRRRIPSVAATWSRRGGALGEGRPSAAELVRPCRSSARRGAAVRARACQPDAAVPGVALEVDDDAFRAVLVRNDIGWTEKED